MRIREIIRHLPIEAGDEVVDMVSHRGALYIVTRRGMLFCLDGGEI